MIELEEVRHAILQASVLPESSRKADAAVDGSFMKGRSLLERCLLHAHAAELKPKNSLRDFFIAGTVFFDALGRERSTLAMTTPTTFPLHEPEGRYEVAILRRWFEDAARPLALAFDGRNGNDYHARCLATASDVLSLRQRAA